ncbi:hypothetical protein [Sphingomonas sp. SUN039]|uniref:hypothetical protein n=1 Tax=Sphingomonas sp. SUN039 TaxID=2937787 RepID=UPI0021641CDC|nr:hypothetical protein [Sphingomonas sp. SUN039]UVO54439.1 hypothetical protein M0209_10005 [Sphingomonas sp. SUN039]
MSALVVVWPQLFADRFRQQHDDRLAELKSGAPETFFEERRALEAYPPLGKPSIWRTLGGLFFIGMLIYLILYRR